MKVRNSDIIRWISGYLSDSLSEKDKDDLASWMECDSRNRELFERLIAKDTFLLKQEQYKHVNVSEAYERFRHHHGIKHLSRMRYRRWVVAACFLTMFLAGGIYMWQWRMASQVAIENARIEVGSSKAILHLADGREIVLDKGLVNRAQFPDYVQASDSADQLIYRESKKEEKKIVEYNEIEVPRGGEYKLTLPDGTFVYMNSSSRIKFPVSFSKERREVYFQGEAYFEVTKNKNCPFILRTDDVRVKVYGTEFNINTQGHTNVETVLVEGSVGIKSIKGGEEVMLEPSQLASFDRSTGKVDVRTVDVRHYTSWKEGFLYFEDESLENILNRLSLWYDVNVFYANDEARNICFTGFLKRYEQIDNILNAIAKTVSVSFDIQGKTVIVYERKR